MADIALDEYLAAVESWIEAGQYDVAVAHCLHILAQFPQHGEARRLLGTAYLHQGQLVEAVDCLQKALCANPENWRTRAALGRICEVQGKNPEATWQYERAFDLAPGNTDIRQELQRLYTEQGAGPTDGLKLESGALGRIYAQNRLFDRAIAEYENALRIKPDLPDVQVGLAEAYWHEGRRLEAVEACLDLLAVLPSCLKANLILGQVLSSTGQESAARERLGVAQAVDPENHVAQEMMGDQSPFPPQRVTLPELDASPAAVSAAGVFLSAAAIGRGKLEEQDAAVEPVPESSELLSGELPVEAPPPEWLLESAPAGEPPAGDGPAADGLPAEPNQAGEPLPEWLGEWEALASTPRVPPLEPPGPGSEGSQREDLPPWLRDLELAGLVASLPAAVDPSRAGSPGAEPALLVETGIDGSGLDEEAARGPASSPDRSTAGAGVPAWVSHMEETVSQDTLPPVAAVLSASLVPLAAEPAVEEPPTNEQEADHTRMDEQEAHRTRIGELRAQLDAQPRNYRARIEIARLCRLEGDWNGALVQYEELIANHKLVPAVIHDLQSLLDEDADKVQVYRLLGDAYMEIDQVDQALEMYRLARQILRKR
jgi:tetratricopeptide (TPR) repeat protein